MEVDTSRLPGFMTQNYRRKAIRQPVNEMDKCTVVSILPKKISEVKHTIFPGLFELNPGKFEKPATLIVGTSSWWQEGQNGMPDLEIPVPSPQIAHSIVTDYCNGILACDMETKMPGLFFLKGEVTSLEVIKNHGDKLKLMKTRQDAWYAELVRITDILWARSNGNPICVSEDAKLAAGELGLKNKPWMGDISALELIPCAACGNLRNPKFPICASCHHIVDRPLYDKLGLAKAG